MPRPRVFVSCVIPDAGLIPLREHCDANVWPHDRAPSRDELIAATREKDALVCLLTEEVAAALLAAMPTVRIVANVAVRFDNLDVPAATAAGVSMTNTPGVLDETTADLAFALLMAAGRRLGEAERLMRSGDWKGWGSMQMLGQDIHHATLGIVGFGRIGRALARRASGFGMKIIYTDAVPAPPEVASALDARFVDMDELLRTADFISLHVPLLPSTQHLIDSAALAKMKKTAVLVNTSRGPVSKRLRSSPHFAPEPSPRPDSTSTSASPRSHPNWPPRRTSCCYRTSAARAWRRAARWPKSPPKNVMAFFAGETPPTALNPEVLKRPARG